MATAAVALLVAGSQFGADDGERDASGEQETATADHGDTSEDLTGSFFRLIGHSLRSREGVGAHKLFEFFLLLGNFDKFGDTYTDEDTADDEATCTDAEEDGTCLAFAAAVEVVEGIEIVRVAGDFILKDLRTGGEKSVLRRKHLLL